MTIHQENSRRGQRGALATALAAALSAAVLAGVGIDPGPSECLERVEQATQPFANGAHDPRMQKATPADSSRK